MAQIHKRFRRWCVTVNNYVDSDIERFRQCTVGGVGVRYACFQRERGAEGTDHLQGYIAFNNQIRLSHLKEMWPGGHFESANGTEEQCIAYCSKTDDTVVPDSFEEFGKREVKGQGSRTDIHAFVDSVKDGVTGKRLFELHPGEYLKYGGSIGKVCRLYSPRRDFKTKVIWCWGETGSGKSRWAAETYPTAYYKNPTNKWYDGWESGEHTCVIVDDYRRDFCTFADLLRIFDRYPVSQEFKGGTVEFAPETIVITTQFPPETTWYGQSQENLTQLTRRIEEVRFFRVGGSDGGELSGAADRTREECAARDQATASVQERTAARAATFNPVPVRW